MDLNVVLRGRRASGISFFVFYLFVGFVLASCSNVFCVSGVFTVKTALIYCEFSQIRTQLASIHSVERFVLLLVTRDVRTLASKDCVTMKGFVATVAS